MKACIYVENKSTPSLAAMGAAVDCINNERLDELPSAVYHELELVDVLEYDERPDILDIAISKMRHGATLKLLGTDSIQIIRALNNGTIGPEEASNKLLNGRMKMNSIHELQEKLTSKGLEVRFASISGDKYILEAVRP